jgi:hypothetical protein
LYLVSFFIISPRYSSFLFLTVFITSFFSFIHSVFPWYSKNPSVEPHLKVSFVLGSAPFLKIEKSLQPCSLPLIYSLRFCIIHI